MKKPFFDRRSRKAYGRDRDKICSAARTGYFFVLFLALCHTGRTQIQLQAALCDNRVNGVGMDPKALFFSWEMSALGNDVRQSAYRLVLSSTREKLEKDVYDIHDTGVVKSDQNIQVRYKGRELRGAYTYFWKVRVWDNRNKASAWSETQRFTTGIFSPEEWKNAQWIGYEEMPASQRVVPFIHGKMKPEDSRVIKNAVSPLFRKEFEAGKKVANALLFISGLGHYEASMNGRQIGKAFLAPGWTNYDKTVLYNTYDVTDQLRPGKNVLGVHLGSGFYHVSQERYVKGTGAFGAPKLIALLKIIYTDGKSESVASDTSWQTHASPVTFNNIYGGEDYDARLEQRGWNTQEFGGRWKNALKVGAPSGKLLPEADYPVILADTLEVKERTSPGPGISVYDFGQNVSGIPYIKVKGRAGQTIKITPAELRHADGTVNQADGVSPHFYTYTLKGDGEETWQPRFSYFAVRYIQVEGEGPAVAVTGLTILHNRYAAPSNGAFTCSNSLFNRIHTLIDWAVKSNIQSYITDNPQREKLSWQGEQNFMRTAINYNYNVYNLYRALIRNMADAQHTNGLVPDIAPEYMQFEGPFVDSPEWGTTAILDTWFLYRFYGDTMVIRNTYGMMRRYARFLESRAENHLLLYGLGDWLDIGNVTPKGVTATAYYFHAIAALSKMAELAGEQEDTRYFRELAGKIRIAFNTRFFNPEKKLYVTGSQTAMAMAVSMGLVEEKHRDEVLQTMVRNIRETDAYKLTAGDVGHRFLVEALFENGYPDVLFAMTNRDDVPGYGYLLKKGATALVETWDGKASQNQLAMGHILEWFHGGIAGITQEEASVAFKHIKIRPQPVGDITWAKGSFRSPYGWIKTHWTKEETGKFTLKAEVPVNTRTTFYVPAAAGARIRVNGKLLSRVKQEKNTAVFETGSGNYEITVE